MGSSCSSRTERCGPWVESEAYSPPASKPSSPQGPAPVLDPAAYGDLGDVDGLPGNDLSAAEAWAMSAAMQRLVGIADASGKESEATGTTFDELSPPSQGGADRILTEDDALDAIREGAPLYRLPEELRANKHVVLAAIEREGAYCFDYISDRRLREADRDVVMALITADGSLLEMVADPLRADREVVRRALRTCGEALRFAPKQLQADRELRNIAGLRAQEEQRMLRRFAEKACGPGAARCM